MLVKVGIIGEVGDLENMYTKNSPKYSALKFLSSQQRRKMVIIFSFVKLAVLLLRATVSCVTWNAIKTYL